MSTCKTCRHVVHTAGKQPACRRYPPYAHSIVVLRKSLVAGGMVPTEENRSMFPSVNLDWSCGEHAPRIEVA